MTRHTIDMCSSQRLLSARCNVNLKKSVLNMDQGTIVCSIKQKADFDDIQLLIVCGHAQYLK